MKQILRERERDARSTRRESRVGHDVLSEGFDECHSRVFATAAPRVKLVVGFGLEGHAESLDADGVAGQVEAYPGDSDTGVVPARDKAREEVERAVGPAGSPRVQDPLDFERVTGLGRNDQP